MSCVSYSTAVIDATLVAGLKFEDRPMNDMFHVMEAAGRPGEVVQRVEIRAPSGSSSGAFLIVDIAPFLGIDLEDVRSRFGPNVKVSSTIPRAPKRHPRYFDYELNGGRLSFGFAPEKAGKLVRVVFNRGGR